MENFIFRKKRKMDEVKHKEKLKELQEKYIPFLDDLITKLKNANTENSREAQLTKMQSLYDLLKNKPKTLKSDILDKTENVLINLYQKFGPAKAIDQKERDESNSSRVVAIRPNLDVVRSEGSPSQLNLHAVKQKLLQVDASKGRDVDVPDKQVNESLLKQKASAIIGDKARPTDPRFERRAVASETSSITLHINKISTVISSRSDRSLMNAPQDAVVPDGYPIPLSNFQGGGRGMDLYCRRTQDNMFYQRRYPTPNNGPPQKSFNPTYPGPSRQIRPMLPNNSSMNPDMNILNSPPLSSDDIQSLMGEQTDCAPSGSTTTVSQSETVRLALKYNPHPPKKSFERSSHLPIDATGNITVSLDDPRLKKPLPPPRTDPRRDFHGKRYDAPQNKPQNTVTKYVHRKVTEMKSATSYYECKNPPPPKKPFNSMERRSELDDDDTVDRYSLVKPCDSSESAKFDKSRAIEAPPRNDQASTSTSQGMKSQFDNMYRKNSFSHDYDKQVKSIHKGIQSFKIPKKAQNTPGNASKEKKSEKPIQKVTASEQSKDESLKEKKSSDDKNVKSKGSRKRIKIIDSDSETSDMESEITLSKRSEKSETAVKVKKANKSSKKRSRAAMEDTNEDGPARSRTSTPEPVSSSCQVDNEVPEKSDDSSSQTIPVETETAKDGITKVWLESFLSNMFNPNMLTKEKLMDIMKNVLDEKKFEKVKSIVDGKDDEEDKEENSRQEEPKASNEVPEKPTTTVTDSAADAPTTVPEAKPKKKPPKPGVKELERLNEDIRTMFISEGVLTATGRRMCTELRRKRINYNESSPTASPEKSLKNKAAEEQKALQSGSEPGPSKRTRGKKDSAETKGKEAKKNTLTEKKDEDIAKKFFEEKRLDINRLLKVELEKLDEKDIQQKLRGKRGRPKKVSVETPSDAPTPKKKKSPRGIWIFSRKKKSQRSVSPVDEDDDGEEEEAQEEEEENFEDTAELPEPPLLKKRPGPKSKTEIPSPVSVKKSETKTSAAPMDITYNAMKPEPIRSSVKNTDLSVSIVNPNFCKICDFRGKNMVSHYLKIHPLNEVFCSRLPKNISEFLKTHAKGMLYADGHSMKLQYSGAKIFGHCIFCKEEVYESPKGWLTHYTRHTGEYEYKCSCGFQSWSVKSMKMHEKKCEKQGTYVFNEIVHNPDMKYIEAYMCGDCNFIQLLEVNTRNHVITEHPNVPQVHTVVLLNFNDVSVKDHHQMFLEMYKFNAENHEEEGVFKTTSENDNEEITSKSILADISKTIPNEPVRSIANKLHERFGERPRVSVDSSDVVVKTELPLNASSSQDTISVDSKSEDMNLSLVDSTDNPISYDDDEWEDIESDSDESESKFTQSKKLARLAQKKRKLDGLEGTPKKAKIDVPQEIVGVIDVEQQKEKYEIKCGTVNNLMCKLIYGKLEYHCLLQNCLYISSSMELFVDHLIKVHDDDVWTGFCNICKRDISSMPTTLVKEFHHLVNEHKWRKFDNFPKSQIKEESRPAIRIRRLSGDKLSAQTEAFKVPTLPTQQPRSVIIRKVSRSPEAPRVISPSRSPPATASTSVSTNKKTFIIRPRSSSTVTSDAISVLKSSTPKESQSIDNADVGKLSQIATKTQPTAKISQRRATISAEAPPPLKPTPLNQAFCLKPWTKKPCLKAPQLVMKMLQRDAIFAAYKCMGMECSYSTNDEYVMIMHLSSHDKMIEDQMETTTITDTSSWLECCYCDYMAGSTRDLISHVNKEHLYCEYLCPKCFYRACNANYVARHLLVYHNSFMKAYRIQSKRKEAKEENPVVSVRENVKLLLCKHCPLKFLNYALFEQHLREHGESKFECTFCDGMIRVENIKKHMACHSIGNFECIYCEMATSIKHNLAQHICDKHPNKTLLYYNRDEDQDLADKFKLSSFDDFCTSPVFNSVSAQKSPAGSTRYAPITPKPSTSNDATSEGNFPVISNVVSLNKQTTPSLVIKDVCTLSKEEAKSLESKTAEVRASEVRAEPIKVPEIVGSARTLTAAERQEYGLGNSERSRRMSNLIADWVRQSGARLSDLLCCSESDCKYKAYGRGEFMEHIDRSHANSLLKCPRCVNVFWHSSSSLWNHLESHSQKRFICAICKFAGKNELQVAEHCMKTAHKWRGYKLVLISNGVEGGIHMLLPYDIPDSQVDGFKEQFVAHIQRKADQDGGRDATDTYGPNDEDKLPTKPVVAKNIYCKLCDYKTMIVKNLVRHFEAHRQDVFVPRLDPVNPVPCLNTSERNFDKMTNLACSSHLEKVKGSPNDPVFLAQSKRFVCGVESCLYITIDEMMLKSHLSTLHSQETSYKCPHCLTELLKGSFAVDPILAHYRLHGPKLYMCDKCQHLNESTVNLEKHIKTVHSGAGNIYVLRDEAKSDTPIVSEVTAQSPDEALPKKWICNECNETTYLKTDMANHVATVHGHKYQYACGYCTTRHITLRYIKEHIQSRHPESKVIIKEMYSALDGHAQKLAQKPSESMNFWRRDEHSTKTIRGIPCESSEILPRTGEGEDEEEMSDEEILPQDSPATFLGEELPVDENVENVVEKRRVETMIQCTICNITTKSALTMRIVHFPQCHPGVPVTTKIISVVSKNVELGEGSSKTTSEGVASFLYKCFHCDEELPTVEEFKAHYVSTHTEEGIPETPPCWYYAVKTMYCGLCLEVSGTFETLSKHLQAVHKTDSVIVKKAKDGMDCGACNYKAGSDQNLLRHAKLHHTNAPARPAITQLVLEQLLQIKMYHMKRCTACKAIICDIDGRQSEEHLRTKHSASVIATFVGIRNPSYICAECSQMFDTDSSSFFHTLLTHIKSFKCSVSTCTQVFSTGEDVHQHMKNDHPGELSAVQFSWPTKALLETLMVFPNGLVMSLNDLQMTKYRLDQNKLKTMSSDFTRKLKITTTSTASKLDI
ncbi:uncharacterized protein LOC132258886 [Phlebotomus argentipes]|uniref:uncharacterized protein LOC132258886 n=1 Tax=Phlebotomus argentipes TaxID=94469 RepID=UPI002892ED11|nr:uncharacterized protein LOC132258886 [Phlebotomus argentipes]XP_059612405.1 uncharacterized protein LOC132258886 [Phlebotomus argentipes]XP_059612406.1 uncharacterized protein LOC132258886 [Phlebotomus argentipes]